MSDLYKALSNLCAERGISGYRMCRDIGIQPSIMTDLKMGRRSSVKAETAQKIASYFGVSLGYLLGEEEKEKPASKYGDGKIENMQLLIEKMKQSGIDLENATPEDLQRWVNIIVAAEK